VRFSYLLLSSQSAHHVKTVLPSADVVSGIAQTRDPDLNDEEPADADVGLTSLDAPSGRELSRIRLCDWSDDGKPDVTNRHWRDDWRHPCFATVMQDGNEDQEFCRPEYKQNLAGILEDDDSASQRRTVIADSPEYLVLPR